VLIASSVYPFKHKTVPEYLFSTSACSDVTTSMETAPPNVALVCVTSSAVTISQNVIPISSEN
jgi:hypothetical protein